nr:putative plus-3 domain, RNA polymerase-associated protein Rtf1 [Tanacetum cinerariifolium]
MLKGLKNHENYDKRISVCKETRPLECKKMGFQNVFKSLLSPETITRIESKSIGNSKETIFANKCSYGSPDCLELKEKETQSLVKHISLYERVTKEAPKEKEKETESLVKHISLYERVTKEAPKGMFDAIRGLRLSRTDILKWSNSQLPVALLDGFFLRLRVAKWKEELGGSRYYVACITGLQGEKPWNGLKQPIRVTVGGVECFVESQYVSNCDFLEDELVAWWEKTSKNGGIPVVKDLKLKLGILVGCNSWVMTNVNDTEADLELTLGSTNRWINSNTTADVGVGVGVGAGANANSRSGMTFVGSDTLAELVWSPRTGLNIKFAEKTPCFMLEVGPSDMGFLKLEDAQTEKQVSEGHSVASLAACRVSGEVVKSSSYT